MKTQGTPKRTGSRRAIGVVRVSKVGEREGDSFVSPSDQRKRIADACARDGLELVAIREELNVSGGSSLEKRTGLRPAVEAVEAGEAEVVVVAYFDRLVRSLAVQAEVVERVERASGAILAVDVGEVRADTASRWLSSTMLGMVAEYHRRVTAERTAEARRRAVGRGVPPFPCIPPGFRLDADRRIEPNPAEVPIVAEAFARRADGDSISDVREFLRANGIERTLGGVREMLRSRLYIGELRSGDLVSIDESRAIVDRITWERVQRRRGKGGRRPVSPLLLARLDILHCGTCGQVMVASGTTNNGKRYHQYRCCSYSAGKDCSKPANISARVADAAVIGETQALLAGVVGRATLSNELDSIRSKLDAAEKRLERAVRVFGDLDDVKAAREQIATLREQRDKLRDRLAEMEAAVSPTLTISATDDWDALSSEEKRALIRAVIRRVDVLPGRGDGRILVQALLEETTGSAVKDALSVGEARGK